MQEPVYDHTNTNHHVARFRNEFQGPHTKPEPFELAIPGKRIGATGREA